MIALMVSRRNGVEKKMTPRTRSSVSVLGVAGALVIVSGLVWPGEALTTTAAQDSTVAEGDAERGRVLFTDYTCFGCHGYTGETGRGPRLNPPRLGQERFVAYLRNPPNPRRMPPYRQADVSDQKLVDIYAFLRSLPSGSPDAENIPVLSDILDEIR